MFNLKKLAGVMLSLYSANAMAIVVTTTNDANTLANTILGGGVTISNATYTGGASAAGTFTGDTVFGLGSGIVLTSGSAAIAGQTVNDSDAAGVDLGLPGDADLNALVPQTTFDAAVLEFEFTTTSGDLFFNWAFGSEEYNEYVNTTFNDVFAFFIDGVNIALAPDGQVASINSINCGNPLDPFITGTNCSSFNNNDLNDGGPFFATQYDGFTNVLTASFIGLGAGTHTAKIAIADSGDGVLDSGVFLQAGTFSGTPTPVSEPGMLAMLGLGLAGIAAVRRRKSV